MARRCPVGVQAQTFLFDRDRFTVTAARSWLRRHGKRASKVDRGKGFFRFRQKKPSAFRGGSLRTKQIAPGIKIVVGCPR